MINLDSETEDPYEIFESLNVKGTALSPADLVRNFIVMKYKHSMGDDGEQVRIFKDYWQPIEKNCGDEHLPQFLMHYCRMTGREVRKKAIYPQFKEHMDGIAKSAGPILEGELARIKSYSALYPNLLFPPEEGDEHTIRPLKLFKELGVTVCYPVLLRLFGLQKEGVISADTVRSSLNTLEAFLIRRAVCNLKNNALDTMFTQILVEWTDKDPAAFIRGALSRQVKNLRWPDDLEFMHQFSTAIQYGRKSTAYILWRLEESYAHKEAIKQDGVTIEHILPQNPASGWLTGVGDDERKEMERWTDTYGNLTLTGYNPELSNWEFEAKKKLYASSHFEMTRAIALESSWSAASTRRRGEALAQRARSIWAGPDIEANS